VGAPAVREWLLDAAARIEAALGLDDGSVGLSFTAERAAFLARMAAGQKWGASSRKVTLVPQRYPGFEALLAAASRPSR
jgi:hypothetical protein